jgi:Gram-negative bacterial TonB protein C-terminal
MASQPYQDPSIEENNYHSLKQSFYFCSVHPIITAAMLQRFFLFFCLFFAAVLHAQIDTTVYTFTERTPAYPGGESALLADLNLGMQQGMSTLLNTSGTDVQGKAYVSFVVDKDGAIREVQMLRPFDPTLDTMLVRVVSELQRWAPGTQNDRPVRVKFTMPLNVYWPTQPANFVKPVFYGMFGMDMNGVSPTEANTLRVIQPGVSMAMSIYTSDGWRFGCALQALFFEATATYQTKRALLVPKMRITQGFFQLEAMSPPILHTKRLQISPLIQAGWGERSYFSTQEQKVVADEAFLASGLGMHADYLFPERKGIKHGVFLRCRVNVSPTKSVFGNIFPAIGMGYACALVSR